MIFFYFWLEKKIYVFRESQMSTSLPTTQNGEHSDLADPRILGESQILLKLELTLIKDGDKMGSIELSCGLLVRSKKHA